eukprot:GSMAST32.ASY1.ANO1.1596.1 assembled CDS
MALLSTIPLYQVDAFAEAPFAGNPAAVCLLAPGVQPSDDVLLKIAQEMNLSETAFVQIVEGVDFSSGRKFRLRWFTPMCEVALCGHATMATASTTQGAGSLFASIGPVDINAPTSSTRYTLENILVKRLAKALGSNICPNILSHLVDELEDLKPNISDLLAATKGSDGVKGLIITLRGNGKYVCFIFFQILFCINEDPVTGSAHTVLAPYWSLQLNVKTLHARQCVRFIFFHEFFFVRNFVPNDFFFQIFFQNTFCQGWGFILGNLW